MKRDNFISLGKALDLTDRQIQGVFKRMEENQGNAVALIEKSFLSTEMKDAYKEVLMERYDVLKTR